MATAHHTAAALIAAHQAYAIADGERMSRRPAGHPRSAWRLANPLCATPETPRAVRDTAFKTRPVRRLAIDVSGDVHRVRVWGTGSRGGVIEVIDLAAPDADARLARYERTAK